MVGGINDPSMYMHRCRQNLSGWMWLYWAGRGVVLVFLSRKFVVGAFSCIKKFNIV